MNLSFLPLEIYSALKSLNIDKLYEIRLRTSFPIIINYDNNKFYLSSNGGKTLLKSNAIICLDEYINYIIKTVCEHSVYAYNDRICNGYLTTKDGVRIGIAGECVFEKNSIITMKNFSSLNIRIPHEIIGCAQKIYEKIINNKSVFNTLLISPPFCGKTTILKDIVRLLNDDLDCSILIIDERGEFSKIKGQNIDSIMFSDKEYAFNCGLRSMSPSIVITDEICTKSDWKCVNTASISGVKIIASVHAYSVQDVINKQYYIPNIFERYVLLKSSREPGVIENIYDKDYSVV